MRQTFVVHDIAVVFVLIGLEALLSVDNCVVLAVLVQHLPTAQRHKALLYGIGGAFVFRFVFVLLASTLMGFWWIQALGASYLIYITFKHYRGGEEQQVKTKSRSLAQTIIAVELTDVAFAGDSVMAGVAMVKGSPEKLWAVYVGGILGILMLRIAITMLTRVVDRWPGLVHIGYGFVAWVGARLMFVALNKFTVSIGSSVEIPQMPDFVFWIGMASVAILGSFFAFRMGPTTASPGLADKNEADPS